MKELRKVLYYTFKESGYNDGMMEQISNYGWFHDWIIYDDKSIYAFIETEEGYMVEVHNREIKFIEPKL
jgi:hypothetical protein